MDCLKGKIAIVTRAASGIRLAISQVLAREGASVKMSDINSGKCNQKAVSLAQAGYSIKSMQRDVKPTYYHLPSPFNYRVISPSKIYGGPSNAWNQKRASWKRCSIGYVPDE